jgi:hypothetical protein
MQSLWCSVRVRLDFLKEQILLAVFYNSQKMKSKEVVITQRKKTLMYKTLPLRFDHKSNEEQMDMCKKSK